MRFAFLSCGGPRGGLNTAHAPAHAKQPVSRICADTPAHLLPANLGALWKTPVLTAKISSITCRHREELGFDPLPSLEWGVNNRPTLKNKFRHHLRWLMSCGSPIHQKIEHNMLCAWSLLLLFIWLMGVLIQDSSVHIGAHYLLLQQDI